MASSSAAVALWDMQSDHTTADPTKLLQTSLVEEREKKISNEDTKETMKRMHEQLRAVDELFVKKVKK
jgi:hypothetical protein